MRKFKAICKTCGEVEIEGHFTNADEEQFIVPVVLAKNIQQYGKIWKEFEGSPYHYSTGNKLSDDLEQKIVRLSHVYVDDEDYEKHSIGKHLVWQFKL